MPSIFRRCSEPQQAVEPASHYSLAGLPRPADTLRSRHALRRYAAIVPDLVALLSALGQHEFHAKEIVSPPNAPSWRKLSSGERLEAFRLIEQRLSAEPIQLCCNFVSKGQYEALKREAEKLGPVSVGYKAGLKRVFLRRLCERLAQEGTRVAIVLDQTCRKLRPQ